MLVVVVDVCVCVVDVVVVGLCMVVECMCEDLLVVVEWL